MFLNKYDYDYIIIFLSIKKILDWYLIAKIIFYFAIIANAT